MIMPGTHTFVCPLKHGALIKFNSELCATIKNYLPSGITISNTRGTFAYHFFYDNLRRHVPLRHFLMVLIVFLQF